MKGNAVQVLEQGGEFSCFMAKVSGLEVDTVDVTRTKYREQTCNG